MYKKKLEYLTNTIAKGFFERTSIDPAGQSKFCEKIWKKIENGEVITPSQIIGQAFFQNLRSMNKFIPELHRAISNVVVPEIRLATLQDVPHRPAKEREEAIIHNWYVGFVESYIKDDQIADEIEEYARRINQTVRAMGFEQHFQPIEEKLFNIKIILSNGVFTNSLDKETLDILIKRISKGKIVEPLKSDPEIVRKLVPMYASLFQLHQNEYKDPLMFETFKAGVIDGLALIPKKQISSEEKS